MFQAFLENFAEDQSCRSQLDLQLCKLAQLQILPRFDSMISENSEHVNNFCRYETCLIFVKSGILCNNMTIFFTLQTLVYEL